MQSQMRRGQRKKKGGNFPQLVKKGTLFRGKGRGGLSQPNKGGKPIAKIREKREENYCQIFLGLARPKKESRRKKIGIDSGGG